MLYIWCTHFLSLHIGHHAIWMLELVRTKCSIWKRLHVCGIAMCKLGLFIRMNNLYIAVSVWPVVFGTGSFVYLFACELHSAAFLSLVFDATKLKILSMTLKILISISALLIIYSFEYLWSSLVHVFCGGCFVLIFYFHNLEVLAPQRPPAPPTEYFQFNLGGYDPDNLIAGSSALPLQGYVGCMRGLKIGDHLFDLTAQVTNESKRGM